MSFQTNMRCGELATSAPGGSPRRRGGALCLAAAIGAALLWASPAPAYERGFLKSLGTNGSGASQFNSPWGVLASDFHTLAVADTFNDRVQRFSWDGTFKWSSSLPMEDQLDRPFGIADWNGHFWVTDSGSDEIKLLHNGGGGLLRRFGGPTFFNQPRDVAANRVPDSSGLRYVYVADTNNNRIWKVWPQAEGATTFVKHWGATGDADGKPRGKLDQPWGVAVNRQGKVYVADRDNDRIVQFSEDGKFLNAWGGTGTANGRFIRPRGVAVSSGGSTGGNVYVADSGNDRVQVFTGSGTFLGKWGSSGQANGQFRFPTRVAANRFGLQYVADTNNHRVQVFGILPQPFFDTRVLTLDAADRANYVRLRCSKPASHLSIGSCRGRFKLKTRRRVRFRGERRKVVLVAARFEVPLNVSRPFLPVLSASKARLVRNRPAARRVVATARIPAKPGVPVRTDRQRMRITVR